MFRISLLLRKGVRLLHRSHSQLRSQLLRLKFQSLYSGLEITSDSFLGKNSVIVCTTRASVKILQSTIDSGTTISAAHGSSISISNAYLGKGVVVTSRESITIKKNCQIAEMVVIRDQNHNFGVPGKTIVEQGFSTAPIIIEENVWLGAKVTVLAGSHIGKNTVVGANSVVRGKLDPNSVYAGIPAKKIKSF